jgi:hypothetical protein
MAVGCSTAAPTCPSGEAGCTRVLFLGNSYTYVNDLPSTFARLAQSAGHPTETVTVANGGQTLAEHASSPVSTDRISAGGWTYVVLQEQSGTPASPYSRDYYMYPAVRTLANRVESAGAWPILFMTWGYRDGLPEMGLPTYDSMQGQVEAAYVGIAAELDIPVAPVGHVWSLVRRDHPEIQLWDGDGSHPAGAGTYLAACVFYVAVFRQSPVGLAFHGGIPDDEAAILQAAAAESVLKEQDRWRLR